jgi:hypothetical protein
MTDTPNLRNYLSWKTLSGDVTVAGRKLLLETAVDAVPVAVPISNFPVDGVSGTLHDDGLVPQTGTATTPFA